MLLTVCNVSVSSCMYIYLIPCFNCYAVKFGFRLYKPYCSAKKLFFWVLIYALCSEAIPIFQLLCVCVCVCVCGEDNHFH